jgi:hypothetical protein
VLPAIASGTWRYVIADDPSVRDLVRLGNGTLARPAATFVADPLQPAEVVIKPFN